MRFCLSDRRDSRLENHLFSVTISIFASSEIFLLSILKCRDSFLSLAPLHSGHILEVMYSLSQSCVFSEPDSCWALRKLMIPSKRKLKILPVDDFILATSSVP